MSRLAAAAARTSLRLRLTLVFSAVMAVVLGAVGAAVVLDFRANLDGAVDTALAARIDTVKALVTVSDGALGRISPSSAVEPGQSAAQLLDPATGAVVDTTADTARPLLAGADLRRAAAGSLRISRATPGTDEDSERLLAEPIQRGGRPLVAVVSETLSDRDESLRTLIGLLAVGGPIALLLAAVAGYGVVSLALRPVERMRSRAAALDGTEPDARLPLPTARDEIHRLGETLNALLGRQARLIARERRFADDASHELRTPLGILTGEVELALSAERSAPELRVALRSIGEEAERMGRLADDLLVLARADGGRVPLRRAPVDGLEILGAARNRFASRAAALGRELRLDEAAAAEVAFAGDPDRLGQAVGNLLDNALRHGAGPVDLWLTRDDDRVRLHVRDHGPGVPPEFVGVAFERFTRADRARGRDGGGSGLGLAIVAAIAAAHGGTAHLENRAEGGVDVWLELPDRPDPGRHPYVMDADHGAATARPASDPGRTP